MTAHSVFTTGILVSLLCWTSLTARDRQVKETRFPDAASVKQVTLTSDISAGRLRIKADPGEGLFYGKVRYDGDETTVDMTYDASGETAKVLVQSELRHKILDRHSTETTWEIGLSPKYTWSVALDVGAADSYIDLSGVPLQSLDIDAGAAECEMVFDKPNPVAMRKLVIDAGAGKVDAQGLGYANWEQFRFDGGAGKMTLNFEGFTDGFHRADISVGVGEVRLEIPANFPVRISADDGWLNSLSIRNLELMVEDDDVMETEGYNQGIRGLEISLDLGIGSAVIVGVD